MHQNFVSETFSSSIPCATSLEHYNRNRKLEIYSAHKRGVEGTSLFTGAYPK